jgi:hypothetical protein
MARDYTKIRAWQRDRDQKVRGQKSVVYRTSDAFVDAARDDVERETGWT